MDDEAKIDDFYLRNQQRKEIWKAFERIVNSMVVEGYEKIKGVILPNIAYSQ